MAEKMTVMVLKLKVDLQCPCCYNKIKKILCQFPQIRNQVYDEKANTVTITVFCCDPEKFRDKLCCKGCKVIKSITIKDPEPPQTEPTEPKPKETVLVCDYPPCYPRRTCCEQCYHGHGGGPCYDPPSYPRRTCCEQCYHGHGGGPCYDGYGYGGYWMPMPPPPCYHGYYYYQRGCHVRSCDCYFS